MQHPKFCSEPEHFIRAFGIIQKDLLEIFNYIEPDDRNLQTYSYRVHELFMRACIEVEANFKAILEENGYSRSGDWRILDYRKIEASHFLSMYEIKLPTWRSGTKILKPFDDWVASGKPAWYQDYHAAKHDRHRSFTKANLENLLLSVAGVAVLLGAQFLDGHFGSSATLLATFGPGDGFENAIGSYFRIKFPDNLPLAERYSFTWPSIKSDPDPFENFPYPP
ncbi:MAG: hypothetical protein HC855_06380 [Rhizobiales bacterium]|nr:hypothetical protein [Hyphomicrobiales bacterium]